LRHCTTIRKFMGSIPNGVIGIYWLITCTMAQPQSSNLSLALWHCLSPVTYHLHYGTASVQWLTTCTMAQPQSSDWSLALWHSRSPVTYHLHYGKAAVQWLITCTMAQPQSTSAMSHCVWNVKTTPQQGDMIQYICYFLLTIMQQANKHRASEHHATRSTPPGILT